MNSWKQYDSEESLLALKRITTVKQARKAACLELLEAARDSRAFCEYMHSRAMNAGGRLYEGKEPPQFEKMDENEFKGMSWNVHGETLWGALSDMPPVDACRPGLWLYITLNAIQQGAIESHFLAAGNNGSQDSGLSRIEMALKSDGNGKTPAYLELSRLILRRSFGAISERGMKGVFIEIPFARVWWQCHIANEIAAGGTGIEARKMADFLTASGRRAIYEELTMRMQSTLTAIADKPVRDGLMHFFYHAATGTEKKQCPENFSPTGDNFKALVRRLGIMLAWRAMGALTAMENSKITYQCAEEIGRGEFS